MSDTNNLINTEIKPRNVIFYLTSEEDLKNIIGNSIFERIFTFLFSMSITGLISISIVKLTNTQLPNEILKNIEIYFWVSVILAVIFGILTVSFYFISYNNINNIKKSQEYNSHDKMNQKDQELQNTKDTNSNKEPNQLKIVSAYYGTILKNIDITENLKNEIYNNKLKIVVSNQIAGDPHPGKIKEMIIEYELDGIKRISKNIEGNEIIIP